MLLVYNRPNAIIITISNLKTKKYQDIVLESYFDFLLPLTYPESSKET